MDARKTENLYVLPLNKFKQKSKMFLQSNLKTQMVSSAHLTS